MDLSQLREFVVVFQRSYLFTLSNWALAAIFLSSSFGKLKDRQNFTFIVLDYQLLPSHWARRFVLVLPWAELAAGLLLLLGLGVKIAAGLSALLLLVFIVALGLNLVRGRKDLKCGCAGARHSQTISGKLVVRNVALLLLAALIMLWGQDSSLAWRFTGQTFAFAVHYALRVGEGTPFTLTLAGVVMLVLLAQQLKRFIQLEARR